MAGKSIKISEREHFRIMCQVFDEVMNEAEHKNEYAKDALIVFSNRVHKKMFAGKVERQRITSAVEKITSEVLLEA